MALEPYDDFTLDDLIQEIGNSPANNPELLEIGERARYLKRETEKLIDEFEEVRDDAA